MIEKNRLERTITIAAHLLIWAYVFASPLLFRRGNTPIDWNNYMWTLYFPASTCIIFYINYLYLVPRYLQTKRYRQFVGYNILLLTFFAVSREFYVQFSLDQMPHHGGRHMRRMRRENPHAFNWVPFIRSFISLLFSTFMASVVRLSTQWRKAETARQEAELGRAEAELKNLKSQINPHFLLNTLNNIYALTAFDSEKARQAIQELSKLLRYVLYENRERFVSLHKEADFLNTYIELMRIRLSGNVDVRVNFDIPAENNTEVAPLIFISLVENAFKHGVSSTRPGFIHISLRTDAQGIHFCCRNSNFPKSENDKSPGDIGLQQVKSRLDHSYPGHYDWQYGPCDEGQTYSSEIHIRPYGRTPHNGSTTLP